MAEHGVPEDDLKPAFLMLSSCENELSKQTLKTDPRASRVHFNKSCGWLQKVYGSMALQATSVRQAFGLDSTEANRLSSSDLNSQGKSQHTSVKGLPDRPRSERVHAQSANQASSTASYDSEIPVNPPSMSSQVCDLEREIESLRGHQRRQSVCLSEERAVKRRLEEDLASERMVRRRLETTVEDLEKQLSLAKEMEGFALQQVELEVEERKKDEFRSPGRRSPMVFQPRPMRPFVKNHAYAFHK
jgi:hypothetical protein